MAAPSQLLRRLQALLEVRNLAEATALLDSAAPQIFKLDARAAHASELLLCVVQWVDVGYGDRQLLDALLKRFPPHARERMPLQDYLRLRMAEAFRALAAEEADKAIEILDFVMKAEQEFHDQEVAALAHFWIGRAHRKQGEYETAFKHITQARKLAESLPGGSVSTAVIKIQESWLLFQKNRRKEALRLLDEAETALQKADYPIAMGNIESARGRIVRRAGEYSKALEHFARAIEIYSARHPQHANLARTLVNSAYVKRLVALQLRKKIDSEKRPAPRNGRAARTEGVNPVNRTDRTDRTDRADRSLLARHRQIWQEAYEELDRAEEIYSRSDNHGGLGSVLMNRGQLYLDNGEIDNAAREAQRAYRLAHEKHEHILMARARMLQAATENAYVDEQLGEDADIAVHASTAMRFCDEALALAEHTQNRRLLARAFLAKGATAANDYLKEWDLAKQSIEQAASLLSSGDRDQLWEEMTALKTKIVRASGIDDTLRAWSEGMLGEKTFQQVTEEFAEIVIPKVWLREQRKVSRVAERLSVSPKKVRRILRNVGLLDANQAE